MNNNTFVKILIHSLLLLLLVGSLSLDMELAKQYSSYLFASQLILMYIYLYNKKNFFLFLTPVMLTVLYINFSFALGSYAFSKNLVLNSRDYTDYLNWNHTNYITMYVLLINTLLFYLDLFFHKKYLLIYSKLIFEKVLVLNKKLIILRNIAIFFFLLFILVPFDVSFLGGSGNMSGVPMTISALLLIVLVAYSKSKYRYIIYLLIIIGFASFSFHSKREAIFFIFPILFLEIYLYKINFTFKLLIKLFLIGLFLLFLILVMSIMRGYGGYDIEGANIFLIAPYVFDYMREEIFLAYLFNNIETNYTYFHSMQAMEYIYENNNLLSYGSTVIKFLFITIPSSIADFKPDSIIHLYTNYRDPSYRSIGGSWPPNIYAEMFWNFYYFGILFIVFIFSILNLVFLKFLNMINSRKIIYHIGFLYLYMQILMYIRGSGLDMFVVYMIFGFFFAYLYTILMLLLINRFYAKKFLIKYTYLKKIYIKQQKRF